MDFNSRIDAENKKIGTLRRAVVGMTKSLETKVYTSEAGGYGFVRKLAEFGSTTSRDLTRFQKSSNARKWLSTSACRARVSMWRRILACLILRSFVSAIFERAAVERGSHAKLNLSMVATGEMTKKYAERLAR